MLEHSRLRTVQVHPELFGGVLPKIDSLFQGSDQTDIVAIFLYFHNFRISAKPPPCQLENDESSACTGHLSDSGPEKTPIQPPPPTLVLFGEELTTLVSLAIGIAISPYDLRRRVMVFDHSIQRRERAVMDILDDSDWMLNQLLRNGCGNSCKHKKNRFNRIVWFYDKAVVGAVHPRSSSLTRVVGSRFSIVYYEEFVISLSLDILKCGKKGGVT